MSRSGPLELRVVEVVRETADAHSLVLEPATGDAAPAYLPGQFLTLRIPSEREGGAARCYSLSSSTHTDDHLKVTVKRTRDGFASNWVCDNVGPGDVLLSLPPSGTFTPRSLDVDLLLVAAGSGITPVMSILKAALHGGRGSVVLLYANRDEQNVIFREELDRLTREHPRRLTVLHWLESLQGIPTPELLHGPLAPYVSREAFVCGPGPFMDAATQTLLDLGAPASKVHVERFTSLSGDPFAERVEVEDSDAPVVELEVTLDGETRELSWRADRVLLDVLLDAGLDAPYSCREGNCSACACFVREGEVDLAHNEVLDASDLADGVVLACQATPRSGRVVVDYEG